MQFFTPAVLFRDKIAYKLPPLAGPRGETALLKIRFKIKPNRKSIQHSKHNNHERNRKKENPALPPGCLWFVVRMHQLQTAMNPERQIDIRGEGTKKRPAKDSLLEKPTK
jgi:hypothetical protein